MHDQENNENFWADDWREPLDWSEFEANYELTGCDTDNDDPDCDLRNWQ
jgi:hypothetical protein